MSKIVREEPVVSFSPTFVLQIARKAPLNRETLNYLFNRKRSWNADDMLRSLFTYSIFYKI